MESREKPNRGPFELGVNRQMFELMRTVRDLRAHRQIQPLQIRPLEAQLETVYQLSPSSSALIRLHLTSVSFYSEGYKNWRATLEGTAFDGAGSARGRISVTLYLKQGGATVTFTDN